jgi:biopolymer transport protein ExbD
MSFAAASSRDVQMADINITPLVDVMLVLLVIFMIAVPTLSQRLRADLPQRGPAASNTHPMQLAIEAGDIYTLDGAVLSRAELGQQLAALAAKGVPPVLEVQASPEAEYETVAQGVATARRAGIETVVLVDR